MINKLIILSYLLGNHILALFITNEKIMKLSENLINMQIELCKNMFSTIESVDIKYICNKRFVELNCSSGIDKYDVIMRDFTFLNVCRKPELREKMHDYNKIYFRKK